MDRFVVKGPPPNWVNGNKDPNAPVKRKKQKKLTQSTILDAKKVISVEKTLIVLDTIKMKRSDDAAVLSALRQLDAKIFEPSVLRKVDVIGPVRELCSHDNKAIADLAEALVLRWQARLEEKPKPQIEVKAGGKDETIRRTCRQALSKFLLQSLRFQPKQRQTRERIDMLANIIERQCYLLTRERRVQDRYKRLARYVGAGFKVDNYARRLLSGETSPEDYVMIMKKKAVFF